MLSCIIIRMAVVLRYPFFPPARWESLDLNQRSWFSPLLPPPLSFSLSFSSPASRPACHRQLVCHSLLHTVALTALWATEISVLPPEAGCGVEIQSFFSFTLLTKFKLTPCSPKMEPATALLLEIPALCTFIAPSQVMIPLFHFKFAEL